MALYLMVIAALFIMVGQNQWKARKEQKYVDETERMIFEMVHWQDGVGWDRWQEGEDLFGEGWGGLEVETAGAKMDGELFDG